MFFGPIGKTKWPPWPLIGWDIFDFSSNGWLLVVLRINVDLAIFQPYLDLEAGDNQSLKIQEARPGIEPRSSCSASQKLNHSATAAPLKPLNGIQQNLTGSKISTSSSFTKFVFFRRIGKTRWLPWPLIGWDIFDFTSETAERNSTKLNRKQDLNVLYQVYVFQVEWIGLDIFDFSSETAEWNSMKLDRKPDLNVLYHVCIIWPDQ